MARVSPRVPGANQEAAGQLGLFTGGLWVRLSPPWSGPFDPPVILTYYSRSTEQTEFGYGWTGLYRPKITELTGTAVALVKGDGSELHYVDEDASGKYRAPGGIRNALVKNSDGTWTETGPDGLKYHRLQT